MHSKILILLGGLLILLVLVSESYDIKQPKTLIQSILGDEKVSEKLLPFLLDAADSFDDLSDNNEALKLISKFLQEGKENLRTLGKRDVSRVLTKNCTENEASNLTDENLDGVQSNSSVNGNLRNGTKQKIKRDIAYRSGDALLRDTLENQEKSTKSVENGLESINEKEENMTSFVSEFNRFLENEALERNVFNPDDKIVTAQESKRTFEPENRIYLVDSVRSYKTPTSRQISESKNRVLVETEGTQNFKPENARYIDLGNRQFIEADGPQFKVPEDTRFYEAKDKQFFSPDIRGNAMLRDPFDNRQFLEADGPQFRVPEDTRFYEAEDKRFFSLDNRGNAILRDPFDNPEESYQYMDQNVGPNWDVNIRNERNRDDFGKHKMVNYNLGNPKGDTNFGDQSLEPISRYPRKLGDFRSQYQLDTEIYSKDKISPRLSDTNKNQDINTKHVHKSKNNKRLQTLLNPDLQADTEDKKIVPLRFFQWNPFSKKRSPFTYRPLTETSFGNEKSIDTLATRKILTKKKRQIFPNNNPLDIIKYEENRQKNLLDAKKHSNLKDKKSLENNFFNTEKNMLFIEAESEQAFEPNNGKFIKARSGRYFEPENKLYIDPLKRIIIEDLRKTGREPKDTRFNEPDDTRFNKHEDTRFNEPEDTRFNEPGDTRFNEYDDKRFNEIENTSFTKPEDTRFYEVEDTRLFVSNNRRNNKSNDVPVTKESLTRKKRQIFSKINPLDNFKYTENRQKNLFDAKKSSSFEEDNNPRFNLFNTEKNRIFFGAGSGKVFEPNDGEPEKASSGRYLESEKTLFIDPLNRLNMEDLKKTFKEPEDGGSNKLEDTRFNEPEDTSFNEPEDTSFNESEDTSFNEPEDTKFNEPEDTSFNIPRNTRFHETEDTRFFSSNNRGNTKLKDSLEIPEENYPYVDQNFKTLFGKVRNMEDSGKHKTLTINVQNPKDNINLIKQNLESILGTPVKMEGFGSQFLLNSENYLKDSRPSPLKDAYSNQVKEMFQNLDENVPYVDVHLKAALKNGLNVEDVEKHKHLNKKVKIPKIDKYYDNQNLDSLFENRGKISGFGSQLQLNSDIFSKYRRFPESFTRKKRNILAYSNPLNIINYEENGPKTLMDEKHPSNFTQGNKSLLNKIFKIKNNPFKESENENNSPIYLINKDSVAKSGIEELPAHSVTMESIQTSEEISSKRSSSSTLNDVESKSLQENSTEFKIPMKRDALHNTFKPQKHNLLKGKNHSEKKWHNGNAFAEGDVSANQKKDNIMRTDQINSDKNADKQTPRAKRKLFSIEKNGEKDSMVTIIRNQKGYAAEDVDYSKQNKGILNAVAIKENSMRNDWRNENEKDDKSPIDAEKAGFIFRTFDSKGNTRRKFANKQNKFSGPSLGVRRSTKSKKNHKKNNQKKSRRTKMKHAGRDSKKYNSKNGEKYIRRRYRKNGKFSSSSNKKNNDLNKNSAKHFSAFRQVALKALPMSSLKNVKNTIDPNLKYGKQLNLKKEQFAKDYKTQKSSLSSENRLLSLEGNIKLGKMVDKMRRIFPKIDIIVKPDKTQSNQDRFKKPLKQSSFLEKNIELTSNPLADKNKSFHHQKNGNRVESEVGISPFKNTVYTFKIGKVPISTQHINEDSKSADKSNNLKGYKAVSFNEPNLFYNFNLKSDIKPESNEKTIKKKKFLFGVRDIFKNINTSTRNIISGIVDGIKSSIKDQNLDFIPPKPKNNLFYTVKDNAYLNEIPIKLELKITSEKEEDTKRKATVDGSKEKSNPLDGIQEIQVPPLKNYVENFQDENGNFIPLKYYKNVVLSEIGENVDSDLLRNSDSSKQNNEKIILNSLIKNFEPYASLSNDKSISQTGDLPQIRDIVKVENGQSKNKNDPKCQPKEVKYYIILQEKNSDATINSKKILDPGKLSLKVKNNSEATALSKLYVQKNSPKEIIHFNKKYMNPQSRVFPLHKNLINDPKSNIVISETINSNPIQYGKDIEENLSASDLRKAIYLEPELPDIKEVEIKEIKGNASNIDLKKEQIPGRILNRILNLSLANKQKEEGINQKNPLALRESRDKVTKSSLSKPSLTKEEAVISRASARVPKFKLTSGWPYTETLNEEQKNLNNKKVYEKVWKSKTNNNDEEAGANQVPRHLRLYPFQTFFNLDKEKANLKEVLIYPKLQTLEKMHSTDGINKTVNQNTSPHGNSEIPADFNRPNVPNANRKEVVFHPKLGKLEIIHSADDLNNTKSQNISFHSSSNIPEDFTSPNLSDDIQKTENVNLTETNVTGITKSENLTYLVVLDKNLKSNQTYQNGTPNATALLKPKQNSSSSSDGIHRIKLPVKPTRNLFKKNHVGCDKYLKLSRNDKNHKTDFENQAHVKQVNGSIKHNREIKGDTKAGATSTQSTDMKVEVSHGINMKISDPQNKENTFNWNILDMASSGLHPFQRRTSGETIKISPPRKIFETKIMDSFEEIENLKMLDQMVNDKFKGVSETKHPLPINDFSQQFLDTSDYKSVVENSGRKALKYPIAAASFDNLVSGKLAEVFKTANLEKRIKDGERNNKYNLPTFNNNGNDILPQYDILMNIIHDTSLKNIGENHKSEKENSLKNTVGIFKTKTNKDIGDDFIKAFSMKNYKNLKPVNPIENYLNPSGKNLFKNAMMSVDNQEKAIELVLSPGERLESLLHGYAREKPNSNDNNIVDQNSPTVYDDLPVNPIENYLNPSGKKLFKNAMMSADNQEKAIEFLLSPGERLESLLHGYAREKLNSVDNDIVDQNNPTTYADLEPLPDQLPDEPIVKFQLNVSPCCKYASKVLGILSGKRNKTFSDSTQRCFCTYCPRYFSHLAKNPFAGGSPGASKEIPPSVYWSRALWLTLQCMKI